MKNYLLLLLLLSTSIFSQYQLKSPYLINPEKNIGFIDSCALFWMNTWDNNSGGFYTNISKTGYVISNWGLNKNMLTQSRNAYGLTRAYQVTGKKEYLDKAKEALEFMFTNAWDNTYGGWFNELDQNGNPVNINQNKTAFYQHYALLGISAYYEVTGDTSIFNWLMKGYNSNEENLWDTDPVNFGYYDYTSRSWSSKNDKSFNATVDAITTHLLYLYLMTQDPVYLNKMEKIADNMLNHLVASMDDQAIGFAEEYNSSWQPKSNETLTIMGHVLKTAWCFARIYHYAPNSQYLDAAKKLINDVLEKGYDHEFGGPYKDYNRVTGEMQMWGNPDTAKAWWQMEQAVVAGLQMYELTNDEKYLQMADETNHFFMNYFVDHVYGEVYENRTRYGDETWGEHKGSGGKAGYHSIELGYYNYLYGTFFLTNNQLTLHYYFEPYNQERTVNLNPLAISSDLIITGVNHNDNVYTNYDPQKRILILSPEVGGEFTVTFEVTNPVNVPNENKLLADDFKLYQNYPNPFNPSTSIEYSVPSNEYVSLKVYDILGNEIVTLVNEQKSAGNYSVNFNAGSLVSGMYVYKLQAGNFTSVKKMLFVK
jgi:mannose/cellobiose epimerase-like protein (N-acyl-D-glucosamine 2-epimerase family)